MKLSHQKLFPITICFHVVYNEDWSKQDFNAFGGFLWDAQALLKQREMSSNEWILNVNETRRKVSTGRWKACKNATRKSKLLSRRRRRGKETLSKSNSIDAKESLSRTMICEIGFSYWMFVFFQQEIHYSWTMIIWEMILKSNRHNNKDSFR